MNFNRYAKLVLCLLATTAITSCSSNTGEVNSEISEAERSQNEANVRRTEEAETERQARTAVAEERMRRSALATRVFYFDFDISEFKPADRDILNYHAQDLASNSNLSLIHI